MTRPRPEEPPSTPPEPASGSVPLRTLLRPLKEPLRRYWHLVGLTILAGWGKFILPMGAPLIIGYLIDEMLTGSPPEHLDQTLLVLSGLSLALVIILGVSTYFRTALAQRLSSYLQHSLRRRLFHHIQRLSMAFFHRHHAGSLGSRVSSDITHAGVVVDKGLIQLSMDGVAFLTLAIVMLVIQPLLAMICFLLLFFNARVIRLYGPDIRAGRKSIQERQSSVTGRAAEFFSAITVVKAYAGEKASGRSFSRSSREVQDLQVENSRLQGRFHGYTHSLLFAAQLIIALVGTALIIYAPGSMTKGNLVQFLLFVGMINGSVQRLTDSMIQIQDGFAALERINDVLTVLPTPADDPAAITPTLTGSMRFEQVRFAYASRPDRTVIEDFSFTFAAGRSYALVGSSGSGKSTLTQLMLRFYDPQAGGIDLDGHPLPKIRQSHFRSQVAAVLQDPIIFSTSVRDNIGFASEEADQTTIERAARAAQAHEFILQMERGYDSPLGERGVALSGGQRQRIAIARALMRDPRILILDEATSALDSVTERSIQQVIDGLQGSRTVVIIAHRLSTVRNVDEILVLENGRLVEHGSYDDLLARGGAFTRLAAEQSEHAA